MVVKKCVVGADRNITIDEYKIFHNYVMKHVTEGLITRFSLCLEIAPKTSKRTNPKYHIQCVFDFVKDPPRDWCHNAKKLMKFNDVLMKSRKSCRFEPLREGQTFLLLACGYNTKSPLKIQFDMYGITQEEFDENLTKYSKLVENKVKKSRTLYVGNILSTCVSYATEHNLTSFTTTLFELYKSGYNISYVIGKIPSEMSDLFDDQMNLIKLNENDLSYILFKK